MTKKNPKNLTKQFVGKPLPQVEAISTDATSVQQGPRKRKQIGNYKKVDSTKSDFIKDYGLPIAGGIVAGPIGAAIGAIGSAVLPSNVKQLASKLMGDARMSNKSLTNDQKVLLWDVIQNAKKRTGKADGGTEYQDYGGLGHGTSEDYNNWFNRGQYNVFEGAYNSLTNPGFELGSTIGRGRYWSDPENPDKMYYTDVYDWNAGEKNFAGTNAYQKVRNDLRAGEDKHLNAQKNENYRMNFELDRKEIEKLKNEKALPIDAYLDRNGGWLEKYNDGGPVQPNYNDASVSYPDNFVGQGYDITGRNYSPAWGGQFQMGGSMPGAVGFTYARTGGIPSNGPYAKKTKASAQNGGKMTYYQNGLDFEPKSISKNGSTIKDDRGQWAHPGEVTEIGSNQITMQGVPYPVLGISDTGDTQMMYPNEDYTYQGSSVTEYPMMQDGGPLSFIGDTFNNAVGYVKDLFKEEKTINPYRDKQNIKPRKPDLYDAYQSSGDLASKEWTTFSKQFEAGNVDTYKDDKNRVMLNTGRFTGANVPASMIDDLAKSAKKNGISLGQMLTLVGRESTFGQQKSNMRSGAKNEYTSGWNVAEDYRPYDSDRFLADQKVPGITLEKSPQGYKYSISDEKAARAYVNAHPELLEQYKAKLAKTPHIGDQNSFDLAARYLKKKGIQGYNPGDPTYVGMFQKDYNTLKQDKNLMAYLRKKGYRYEDGGELTKLDQLTNFTNYNTKQPGGWLDKYQD